MSQRKHVGVLGPQTMAGQSRFVSEFEAREARNLLRFLLQKTTQRDLAIKLGVSKTTLHFWLECGRAPSREAFGKIMRFMGAR